ncbi:MAG: M48 family metallopeptidase [Pyramidobacter sp.]|nr:M48 family metallopeptidase [Pyramidobacter sp.]
MERRCVTCGGFSIVYDLERKAVHNLNLRVRPDRSVFVSAAPEREASQIDRFVASKAEFIRAALAQYARLEALRPAPHRYVNGEAFMILGRSVRLLVRRAKRNSIGCDGVFLRLKMSDISDRAARGKVVSRWLSRTRREVFAQIVAEIYPAFGKYGVAYPALRIRPMRTRWGSCLPQKGVITLNSRLLEVPRSCAEYVVLHELCHFLHPDHSRAFYACLTVFMPDWRQRKAELEKWGAYEY